MCKIFYSDKRPFYNFMSDFFSELWTGNQRKPGMPSHGCFQELLPVVENFFKIAIDPVQKYVSIKSLSHPNPVCKR